MELIDAILTFSKRHAQVVIVVLLGTIATGSIAGAMRIAGLRDLLAERDVLWKQRDEVNDKLMTLVESTAARKESRMAAGAGGVTKSFAAVAKAVERLATVTTSHAIADTRLANDLVASELSQVQRHNIAVILQNDATAVQIASTEATYEVDQAGRAVKLYLSELYDSSDSNLAYQPIPVRLTVRRVPWSWWALILAGVLALILMILLSIASIRDFRRRSIA